MKKFLLALSLAVAAALALAGAPSQTSAQGSGLLEFVRIGDCPRPCPIGADICCAHLPPICVPDPPGCPGQPG